jgi:peptidoglycan-associated lipoprotein
MNKILSAIIIIMLFSACHKTAVELTTPEATTTESAVMVASPSPSEEIIEPSSDSLPIATPVSVGGQVFFDFDKHAITVDGVDVLAMVAEYLSQTNENIIIEGNCDERGTVEYNRRLGLQRAISTETVLITLGVSQDRIVSVVSNGKEVSECESHTESCWKRNRRVDIFIEGK